MLSPSLFIRWRKEKDRGHDVNGEQAFALWRTVVSAWPPWSYEGLEMEKVFKIETFFPILVLPQSLRLFYTDARTFEGYDFR